MKNHIALRLFLALNLLITAGAMSTRGSHLASVFLLLVLGALLAIADTLVNDILPARFHLRVVENRRHSLYLVLAGLCVTAAFAMAVDGSATWLMVRLILDATLGCWCAVMDVKHRYVTPRANGSALHANE